MCVVGVWLLISVHVKNVLALMRGPSGRAIIGRIVFLTVTAGLLAYPVKGLSWWVRVL